MKLIRYARITYRHAVRAPPPSCDGSTPMSQIPGPSLLFETVAFTKKLKIIPTLPNSNFPSQQNISNYTNINTVSAYSKSTGLPEPLGSVRHRANTTPVAAGLMLGLPPSSSLFSPHPEFRSHRAQSSEGAIHPVIRC